MGELEFLILLKQFSKVDVGLCHKSNVNFVEKILQNFNELKLLSTTKECTFEDQRYTVYLCKFSNASCNLVICGIDFYTVKTFELRHELGYTLELLKGTLFLMNDLEFLILLKKCEISKYTKFNETQQTAYSARITLDINEAISILQFLKSNEHIISGEDESYFSFLCKLISKKESNFVCEVSFFFLKMHNTIELLLIRPSNTSVNLGNAETFKLDENSKIIKLLKGL